MGLPDDSAGWLFNVPKTRRTYISLESKSLSQILRMNKHVQEKWREASRKEINDLFDDVIFKVTERSLPADEIIPV